MPSKLTGEAKSLYESFEKYFDNHQIQVLALEAGRIKDKLDKLDAAANDEDGTFIEVVSDKYGKAILRVDAAIREARQLEVVFISVLREIREIIKEEELNDNQDGEEGFDVLANL